MQFSQSIFASEVRKRLAEKRIQKMKNSQVIVDQIPLGSIKYHRKSLLLSCDINKNNEEYIEKFIREKAYKSFFKKKKLSTKKIHYSNISSSLYNSNLNDNAKKIPKRLNKIHSYSCFPIKKNHINTPKKTPFQLSHIKINYFKYFINCSQKNNNLSVKLKEDSIIDSFSINKYNEKKKIFGQILKDDKQKNKNKKILKLGLNKTYNRKIVSALRKDYKNKLKDNNS